MVRVSVEQGQWARRAGQCPPQDGGGQGNKEVQAAGGKLPTGPVGFAVSLGLEAPHEALATPWDGKGAP